MDRRSEDYSILKALLGNNDNVRLMSRHVIVTVSANEDHFITTITDDPSCSLKDFCFIEEETEDDRDRTDRTSTKRGTYINFRFLLDRDRFCSCLMSDIKTDVVTSEMYESLYFTTTVTQMFNYLYFARGVRLDRIIATMMLARKTISCSTKLCPLVDIYKVCPRLSIDQSLFLGEYYPIALIPSTYCLVRGLNIYRSVEILLEKGIHQALQYELTIDEYYMPKVKKLIWKDKEKDGGQWHIFDPKKSYNKDLVNVQMTEILTEPQKLLNESIVSGKFIIAIFRSFRKIDTAVSYMSKIFPI